MHFLPIVERELRVRARQRPTYRLRALGALLLLAVWLFMWLAERPGRWTPALLGRQMFAVMESLGLVYALLAGVFYTADGLSAERREGTLGLLFLTELTGFDVVLGKLVATAVHGVYALLAGLPVLGLPVLMGGVSGMEFFGAVLLLFSALLMSLGLGLMVSGVARESMGAVLTTFLAVLGFTGVCPAMRVVWFELTKSPVLDAALLWPSAFYGLVCLLPGFGRGGPSREFYGVVATLAGLGMAGFVGACVWLPRSWRDTGRRPLEQRWPWWGRWRYGTGAERRQWRGYWLALNPFEWVMRRDRLTRITAWALVIVLGSAWLLLVSNARQGMWIYITSYYFAYGLHAVVKLQMAAASCRRFSEDRHSGALELLLVTPLEVPRLLAGHREALGAAFKGPIAVLMFVNLAMLALTHADLPGRPPSDIRFLFTVLLLGGMGALAVDAWTIRALGAWLALRVRRYHLAVLATAGLVQAVPLAVVFGLFLLLSLGRGMGTAALNGLMVTWLVCGLVYSSILGATFTERVGREFRRLAAGERPMPEAGDAR